MVKFLIIRFSSIGDIILTTPAIRLLKTQVDDSVIHYLIKEQYASILESNPYIDKLHLFSGNMDDTVKKLKREDFDYIIDLHHNIRSLLLKKRLQIIDFSVDKLNVKKWMLVNLKINRMPDKHMVDRNLDTLKVFDVQDDEKGLDYFIPRNEEVDIETIGEKFNSGFIVLAIGARHHTKKLPPEKLLELAGLIKHPVVILGGPEDKETGDAVCKALPSGTIFNGAGKFSVNQSASLIKQARLVISHDTGMMHIAAAFRKKILSVWGNTVPLFGMYPYRPGNDSYIFEVNGLRCRPCSKIGYQRCPRRHFKCMIDQDITAIAEKANDLFTAQ
ncbi:MAG TPA: glycosyltransferase family 9 protein [Bacteroidaceae bacterium]|nr:glycosyltransferase family 9 protein [Bacteroidaceae bacterium]